MRVLFGLAMVCVVMLVACSSATTSRAVTPTEASEATIAPVPVLPTTVPPTAVPPTAAPTPTALPTVAPPTPTPPPTATPVPQAQSSTVASEFGVELLNDERNCSPLFDLRDHYPPRLERTCSQVVTVTAPANGIVVGVGRTLNPLAAFQPTGAPINNPHWAWSDLDAMGSYVIIDHGVKGVHDNVTSVTWGFDPSAELHLGARVTDGDPLGSSLSDTPVRWQLWTGEEVYGVTEVVTPPPSFDAALTVANGLAPLMASPVVAPCTIDLTAPSDFPNAGRPYRSGTHRGVDMICGSTGNLAFAALDGTVVAVVKDYVDLPVQPRLDSLNNAALGGGTPQWTLNMLFGNFVVIEHEDPDGREVLTISAHMERVEPEIIVGAHVTAGTLLGEVGNRGTGPSAAGSTLDWDRSRHLHWEIFVDGDYLGAGLDTAQTAEVYRSLLCGAAPMNGC